MSSAHRRLLLVAVHALAVGMMLLEVLAFRLCAAVMGPVFASFVGLSMPAAAAFGAVLLSRFGESIPPARVLRRAAHVVALAGSALALATIGLGWASQVVARAEGQAAWYHAVIAMAGWQLSAFASGGAVALVLRGGLTVVGRVGWALGFGGALGCLSLVLLPYVGAPRATLVAALLYAVAALLLAHVAREAQPRWSVLAAFPLAIVALLVGDLGNPWMELRTDFVRRTRWAYSHWTAEGLIAVEELGADRAMLAVDRSRKVILSANHGKERGDKWAAQDLLYALVAAGPGPTLVIGSAGGREITKALSQTPSAVDAIELHEPLVNEILAGRYADRAGHLFADERVRIHIGDGSSVAAELPRHHYRRVLILGETRFAHAAPRLLTEHDRLLTREALQRYFERLTDDGSLSVRIRSDALPGLLTTLASALGGEAQARERTVACVTLDRSAVAVVHMSPLAPGDVRLLTSLCAAHRMPVAYVPIDSAAAKSAELPDDPPELVRWTGWTATDRQPFLEAPPGFTALLTESRELVEPVPRPGSSRTATPKSHPAAAAAAAAALSLLVLLGLWAWPHASRSVPLSRWIPVSLGLFGLALSMCSFALVDRLMVIKASSTVAWTFLVPATLAGMACGRLWVDAAGEKKLRERLPHALGAGGGILLLALVASRADSTLLGSVPVSGPLLLVFGAVLGAPLFALLRLENRPSRVGIHWGVHLAGWALGGALSVLLAHYAGVPTIMPIGFGAYALAAVVLVASRGAFAPPRSGSHGMREHHAA